MKRVVITAEIGINHNGSINHAINLIEMAADCGCDAVKFQVRNVDACYTPERLAEPKESPWGKTYGDYARGRELSFDQLFRTRDVAHNLNMAWGFSVWDVGGASDAAVLQPDFVKIPSAKATDLRFVGHVARTYRDTELQISTGGMNWEEIDSAITVIDTAHTARRVIYHCIVAYPSDPARSNLLAITKMKLRYGRRSLVGFSSHCTGPFIPAAAVAVGAGAIEVHITLDRAGWGTDQAASLESRGLETMVRNIRALELGGMGPGEKEHTEYESKRLTVLRRGMR